MIEDKRGEKDLITFTQTDQDMLIPLTREGFEQLVKSACLVYNLPVDDITRQFAVEYIHHLEKEVEFITIKDLAHTLYRRSANHVTWIFSKEIDKRNKEMNSPKLVSEPDIEH